MLGYCPGVAVGATTEGQWDALSGEGFGMLVGAGVFSETYPLLKNNVLELGEIG